MSRSAWAYVWFILLTAALLSALSGVGMTQTSPQWPTFVILTALATLAQLRKAEAPNHQLYYATLVFTFAGVLLLHPFFFVLQVTTAYLIEWIKERLLDSPHLRAWYLQPFNIATDLIAGFAALAIFKAILPPSATLFTPAAVFGVAVAGLTWVVVNRLLIGFALVLARGKSWRESGILDSEGLTTEFILLCLGYVVAALWQLNPWLILPALSPLVLIYRALMIPQLRQEAQTDAKTGLWNARHFTRLFTSELDRATRFGRPLAVIMADLDLLRNINNTYGHLAGDAVLAGIGRLVRETVREYDIAARFGGEEFAIALPEATPAEAAAIAERLRAAVEASSFVVATSPTPIRATLSLGVANFPVDARTTTELIHEADVAVYQAKLKGRNRVVAAADVPHYLKLDTVPLEERLNYAAGPPQPAKPVLLGQHNGVISPVPPQEPESFQSEDPSAVEPGPREPRDGTMSAFVGSVIGAGLVMAIAGFATSSQIMLGAILLFAAVAIVSELFQVDLYGGLTISVSVAVMFATALIAGMPGVAVVSAAMAAAHYVRRRPALYKTLFSWATHVLAGGVPLLLIALFDVPLQVSHLLLLGMLVAVAALGYYLIDTGLIAVAVSLETGATLLKTWRERFEWLATHYVVLGLMGLFVAMGYNALGWPGLVVFALPVLIVRYAHQQYIERTEDSVQELQRMNKELTRANREVTVASQAIQQLNDELFLTLAKIIDARDPYVSGHAAKVADYATAIAVELGLSTESTERVRQAAFLHDIGKIAISEQILHKPASLTPEEYEQVKRHAALGADFLQTCQGLRHLSPFVRHHHERWDGSGYPGRLRGEKIPLEARILAVCDAVEAMASDRPYHHAMATPEIVAEIKRSAGTQFDPQVAEVFVQIAERDGEGFVVNSAREVARRRAEHDELEGYGTEPLLLDSLDARAVASAVVTH